MGRPKAALPFGGVTLLDWVVARLGPAFAEVLVSANGDADPPPDARVVPDLHPFAGPLAGIEAGLRASAHGRVFAVACDMPLMTAELARTIVGALAGADAAVPSLHGRPEPACAAYARSAAPAIAAALERGERRAAVVLQELNVNWLSDLDAGPFRNVNTPEDYQELLDAPR
jgi:molybdopterin-guanine dinucleotide biosynthesis protein A